MEGKICNIESDPEAHQQDVMIYIVSKEADRSKRVSIETCPWSMLHRKQLVI